MTIRVGGVAPGNPARCSLPAAAAFLQVVVLPAAGQQVNEYSLRQADLNVTTGFTQITSVREIDDGRLIVADRRENTLVVVDLEIGSTRPIGRTGDGPGEYRGAGWLYPLGGDSTLLTDWQTRRWYILDETDIVRTLPASSPLPSLFDPILSGTSVEGGVLDGAGSVFSSRSRSAENADSLLILLANRSGERIDTIARVRGRGAPTTMATGRGASIAHNPLAAEDLALLFPDGWVAVAYLEPYRVDWRRPDGSWIRGSALPFESVSVTRREKCAALQRRFGSLPGDCDQASVPDWPDVVPAFLPISSSTMSAPATLTLFATPDGRLVVRRTPVASSPTNRYDFVDRSGRLAGLLELPANEAIIGFGTRSIYIVVTDHNDLQWLRRHPWP